MSPCPETQNIYPPQPQAPGEYGTLMPGMTMPSSLPIVQPPELHFANGGNAITVQWKSVGPLATSYIIELRESTTSASNLFTRVAPQEGTESLELCIQGLEPGRSYIACVRSVTRDGIESLSSPWSSWLTFPHTAPYMPSLALQEFKVYEMPSEKPEKQMGVVETQAASQIPEITGQEDLMLFLD